MPPRIFSFGKYSLQEKRYGSAHKHKDEILIFRIGRVFASDFEEESISSNLRVQIVQNLMLIGCIKRRVFH